MICRVFSGMIGCFLWFWSLLAGEEGKFGINIRLMPFTCGDVCGVGTAVSRLKLKVRYQNYSIASTAPFPEIAFVKAK